MLQACLSFLAMEYHAAMIAAAGQPPPLTPARSSPRIYVDADACPVKDEIYRVAARHGLPVTVVGRQFHPRAHPIP